MSDKLASWLVSLSRRSFDLVTGYRHGSPDDARRAMERDGEVGLGLEVRRRKGYVMTLEMWTRRILFLESIAGVPGMMHLLTFMKISNPGWMFRLMILGAQGVYCNLFFLAYLISPSAAHRFVGYLEEEAVVTYTQIADEIKRGNLPEWDVGGQQVVPQISVDYWRLGKRATMLDLILAVRADEAGHRFVNHTLANLDSKTDFNPFGLRHADAVQQGTLPGISRDESLAWMKKVEEELNIPTVIEDEKETGAPEGEANDGTGVGVGVGAKLGETRLA
ncbi:AOX-domain-containing protein [Meredithblackwellia eburnea MCA 4105]